MTPYPGITSPARTILPRAEAGNGCILRSSRYSDRLLPYPPYGRRVAAILRQPERLKRYSGSSMDGTRGTVWVANGPDAWTWVKTHPRHLTIGVPHGGDPREYRWDFLRGQEPILLLPPAAKDECQREHFAVVLLAQGVRRLMAGGVIYRRGQPG
jgi:hypothetical protein